MTCNRVPAPISVAGGACCGCAACAAACPSGCITMKADGEGFDRPVVDSDKCTGCGLCARVCPVFSERREDDVLSTSWAVARDGELLGRTSSGGVFGVLAKSVISQGGTVYGARWEDGCRVVAHARADDGDSVAPLLMSKYLQSKVRPEIHRMVEVDLKAGRPVLFCGTACQVAGLTGYLKAKGTARDGLLAVDVICHGAPSPLLWQRWMRHVGHARLSSVLSVEFRRKDPSWEAYSVAYRLALGRELVVPHATDWYLLAFLRNICLRRSCATCPAKGRCGSDATLGDFWGIGRVHPEVGRDRGVSAVIVRTERGRLAFEKETESLTSGRSEYRAVLEGNPSLGHAPSPHPERDAFMAELAKGAGAAKLRKLWPLGLPPEPSVPERVVRKILGLFESRRVG